MIWLCDCAEGQNSEVMFSLTYVLDIRDVVEHSVVEDRSQNELGHRVGIQQPPEVDDHPHCGRFENLVLF